MPIGKRVKAKFKQMAFETAVRNPERYKKMLAVLKGFEAQILTDKVLIDIIVKMFLDKAVTSEVIKDPESLQLKKLTEKIIKINKSRRADGGFPTGYASRFWTYVRTLAELGFVYARYNKKLLLSNTVHKLLNNEIDEQEAFAIQAMKYNRKSPYRNVLNDFNYFRFVLEVLLKKDDRTLSYNQFILSLFSTDGDSDRFIEFIKRERFKDVDSVYSYIVRKKLSSNKKNTVVRDYPDVVLRLLRITGFITIVFKGIMFIKINELKKDFIKSMLSKPFYITDEEKKDAIMFYNRLNSKDEDFIKIVKEYRKVDEIDGSVYASQLSEIISMYKLNERELSDFILNKQRIREEFKYIPDPLKLEFFISLLVAIIYGSSFKIKPNYKADSIGMPISHAPGLKGDIEVFSKEVYWLLEVTLIQNKIQQLNSETTSNIRHFNTDKTKFDYKYLSFVAPYIHKDTENYYNNSIVQMLSEEKSSNIYMKPYSLDDFVNITLNKENFNDMQQYSNKIIEKIRNKFKS